MGRVEIFPGRKPAVSLVLDSSATLAWIYAEETTDAVRRIFEIVAENGAVVPAIWRLEVANSLTVARSPASHRCRLRNAALIDLAMLDITTDLRLAFIPAGSK